MPDPGSRSNDVYYTYSTDNGRTWSKNTPLSDRSIIRTYGVWGVNYDMSSPPGIAATDGVAVFGWDDTRFTDPNQIGATSLGGGTSDMFGAAVQFKAVGGARRPRPSSCLRAWSGCWWSDWPCCWWPWPAVGAGALLLPPKRTTPKAKAGVS